MSDPTSEAHWTEVVNSRLNDAQELIRDGDSVGEVAEKVELPEGRIRSELSEMQRETNGERTGEPDT